MISMLIESISVVGVALAISVVWGLIEPLMDRFAKKGGFIRPKSSMRPRLHRDGANNNSSSEKAPC